MSSDFDINAPVTGASVPGGHLIKFVMYGVLISKEDFTRIPRELILRNDKEIIIKSASGNRIHCIYVGTTPKGESGKKYWFCALLSKNVDQKELEVHVTEVARTFFSAICKPLINKLIPHYRVMVPSKDSEKFTDHNPQLKN